MMINTLNKMDSGIGIKEQIEKAEDYTSLAMSDLEKFIKDLSDNK